MVSVITDSADRKSFQAHWTDRAEGKETRLFPAGDVSSGEKSRVSLLSRAQPGNFSIC
ncbi:Uncharacterized protein dnm_013010 [Desulfonema magnum]|uniref:Uncharacterized protein n=1 Tax=Desulfonema magnum TaxID=45655 RepID=A0A975BH52_9BACT|nr:Uncharacterized protein dnm_013010 [Desulfonema magnum]